MDETTTTTANVADVPFTLLFGLVVVLLVRSGELKLWIATVSGLFGFYLASSGAAPLIRNLSVWLLTGLTHTY
ncbi:hypothetical protein LO772_20730 [Yinghuangia sp. ASG 101]|uniref:hypothetical protein n=1 Tax=Yinghuangia sp. ASG 101 TaxID=2896848 RepID=UPI001E51D5D3|nr:hypothetical protein [Yinghuangia sp. ASG 101]UGQ09360.1 hypothetical protein LO772_20730 [Yinghuangia sp. ASG 101]